MRLVVALGGNALLRRGDPPDAEPQRRNVAAAVAALAPLLAEHDVVITHGNGPQIGVLATESADDPLLSTPFPLDPLGAETQGLIGYWLTQELRNALPGRQVAAVLTQCVVDREDPAFTAPTKFVGAVHDEIGAAALEARGWTIGRDGDRWRRIVASPEPTRIVEAEVILLLSWAGVVVVCAGGGGIPVVEDSAGHLAGIEAVIDKDLTSALLAEIIGADALVLLTDVDGVETAFGAPDSRVIRTAGCAELRALELPAGSMGPKVEAACRFVERTGGRAMIGSLRMATEVLAGRVGTTVTP